MEGRAGDWGTGGLGDGATRRRGDGATEEFFIFHFPFDICHFPFSITLRGSINDKWKMENGKWKMKNSSVAPSPRRPVAQSPSLFFT